MKKEIPQFYLSQIKRHNSKIHAEKDCIVPNHTSTPIGSIIKRRIAGKLPKLYHLGIYIGGNRVIHFTGESKKETNSIIKCTTFIKFASKEEVIIKKLSKSYSHAKRICNCAIRVLESLENSFNHKYSIIFNNCEDFVKEMYNETIHSVETEGFYSEKELASFTTLKKNEDRVSVFSKNPQELSLPKPSSPYTHDQRLEMIIKLVIAGAVAGIIYNCIHEKDKETS